jgi:exonuclease VII small subunit
LPVLEKINAGDLEDAEELIRQAELDLDVAEEQTARVLSEDDDAGELRSPRVRPTERGA